MTAEIGNQKSDIWNLEPEIESCNLELKSQNYELGVGAMYKERGTRNKQPGTKEQEHKFDKNFKFLNLYEYFEFDEFLKRYNRLESNKN